MSGRHWPKAEIRDDKLLVEGERYPFVRGMKRNIWLAVGKLTHKRHIEIEDGRTRRTDRLSAIATIENDTLAIAGVKGTKDATQELSFSIEPAPDEEKKFHWNVSFGFPAPGSPAGADELWYCEVYLPARAFNDVVAACKSGMLDRLRLGCACDMWVRDGIQRLPNLPVDAKVTWFLSPPLNGGSKSAEARGVVEEWFEVAGPGSIKNEDAVAEVRNPERAILRMILAALIAILAALVVMAVLVAIR